MACQLLRHRIFAGKGCDYDLSKICLQELGEASTDPLEIADADLSSLSGYDGLIVGAPTWNTGADTERSGTGWDNLLDDIRGESAYSLHPRAYAYC